MLTGAHSAGQVGDTGDMLKRHVPGSRRRVPLIRRHLGWTGFGATRAQPGERGGHCCPNRAGMPKLRREGEALN